MQLAEAIVESQYEKYRTGDDRMALYASVFDKHQISQEKYDSSLVWYGKNMDLYMQIYKLVLKDINSSIDLLGDVKPNPLSGEVSAKDSIDVWIYKRRFTLQCRKAMLTFGIEPKAPYSSGSSYVLGLNIWGITDDMPFKPRISLYAVQQDTVINVNQDITSDGYYETVIRTVATKPVKKVFGYIIFNTNSINKIYIDGIHLMKYNYGSQALTAPKDPSATTSPAEEEPAADKEEIVAAN
jgi:hypothetical protein